MGHTPGAKLARGQIRQCYQYSTPLVGFGRGPESRRKPKGFTDVEKRLQAQGQEEDRLLPARGGGAGEAKKEKVDCKLTTVGNGFTRIRVLTMWVACR